MKIHPVEVELFPVDGQTHMSMLAVAFRYFMKAPKSKGQTYAYSFITSLK
jgi:hypothetical protein